MSSSEYPHDAKRRVEALIETLEPIARKGVDQELGGIAVPAFQATLAVLAEALPEDPVVAAAVSSLSDEIESGSGVRAGDALLVERQIDAAIGPAPIGFA